MNRLSLDELRDKLQDKHFWLGGYKTLITFSVQPEDAVAAYRWNIGVGPTCSFTGAISAMIEERCSVDCKDYRVMKVDLKPVGDEDVLLSSMGYQVAMAVAKQLGLLDDDHDEYHRLKNTCEIIQYHAYCQHDFAGGDDDDDDDDPYTGLKQHIRRTLVPKIIMHLSNLKYLLLLHNLQSPIDPIKDVALPPIDWKDSLWFISATSRHVYDKSRSRRHELVSMEEDHHIVHLVLSALERSSKQMLGTGSEEHWHMVAVGCFHYAMAVFSKYSLRSVTSDELIHQWVAQGILPRASCRQTGRAILEAFHGYSLLQLPFATIDGVPTKTGTHFFAHHGLVAEDITLADIFDGKKKKKKWISFDGDNGWHVSREWLSQEEGPTSLILRGCSGQSPILSKLEFLLPKLCFLRVLDLSYTQLQSLPSSIRCLVNLRLLSLRGCHDLKTLFSSSNSTSDSPLSYLSQLEFLDMNGAPISHLPQDMFNQNTNLIHLDMSYSKVTNFPRNCFHGMSNLEELILVNCSNLVELPPSLVALSSLTTLEVTGTQIRHLPENVFDEMPNLHSLKLIDNKKLIALPRSVSMAPGLIHLHIGGDSLMEKIEVEEHHTLTSFMLIGAPQIRRLSLSRCRKLESVELKNLGALEELNLSATSIKELPADIPNLPKLSSLLLMGVPSLRRFPWHKLERLPHVFCLDHCAEETGNHPNEVNQIHVSDSKFFYSFRKHVVDSVRIGCFFQTFGVRVSPCAANTRRLQDEETMLEKKLQALVRRQSTYLDVYRRCDAEQIMTISPIRAAPFRRSERHVEISWMEERPQHGALQHLLNVTKSMSVTHDTSISCLSSLSSFDELEECELGWCHDMQGVINMKDRLKNVRNMHVYNLKSLCSYSMCHYSTTSRLQHLHLEYCPRLEKLMPFRTSLPYLKTLDILFCYNLKTIFFDPCDNSSHDISTYELPKLERVCLQELPLLQHFHDNDNFVIAPIWKELHVRGCWSLRHLPLLQDHSKVKVTGERNWWGKLHWGSTFHCNMYEPKVSHEFASFDECAKMSSYLR